jgi:arginine exporter protein ArgO
MRWHGDRFLSQALTTGRTMASKDEQSTRWAFFIAGAIAASMFWYFSIQSGVPG